MMRSLLLAVAGLALGQVSALHAGEVWLEVTRPMVACDGPIDTEDLADSLADALPKWLRREIVEMPCFTADPGKKVRLEGEFRRRDGSHYLKAWEFICHDCVPLMSPIYLPTRKQAGGGYLRPTTAPDGYEAED